MKRRCFAAVCAVLAAAALGAQEGAGGDPGYPVRRLDGFTLWDYIQSIGSTNRRERQDHVSGY
jgi:hypothetical protein